MGDVGAKRSSRLYTLSLYSKGEGKRRGCCGFFHNRRDARVRVQETVAIDNCQAFSDNSPLRRRDL